MATWGKLSPIPHPWTNLEAFTTFFYPISLMLSSAIFYTLKPKNFLRIQKKTGGIFRQSIHLSKENAWKWDIIEFIIYHVCFCFGWVSLHCFNSWTPGIIYGPISSRCMGVVSRRNYSGELCFLWRLHDVSSICHVLLSIKKWWWTAKKLYFIHKSDRCTFSIST